MQGIIRWRTPLLVVGLISLLLGCEATGKKIDQARLVEVEKGRTTYTELVQRYGTPNTVLIRDDGTRQATFTYVQMQVNPLSFIPIYGNFVRSSSAEHAETVFEFDAQGLLVGYTSVQGETVRGTGHLSGAKQ